MQFNLNFEMKREPKTMEIVNNVKKPTIDTKLLVNLSKAGRSVLAYIIDKQMNSNVIHVDKLEVSNYIAEHVGKKEAHTWNIERGIKDLVDNGVLMKSKNLNNMYMVNLELLSK